MSFLRREVTIPCKFCNGSGEIRTESIDAVSCQYCNGSGRVRFDQFERVKRARGKITKEKNAKYEWFFDMFFDKANLAIIQLGAALGAVSFICFQWLFNLTGDGTDYFWSGVICGGAVGIFVAVLRYRVRNT